jgi:NADH-quinone oxidoreductase subunit L
MTYAIGMMALAGVPLFAGFWSKDEILHNAAHWSVSPGPFWLGAFGALLTAFYMTRQVCYVFCGQSRAGLLPAQNRNAGHGDGSHAWAEASSPAGGGQAGSLTYVPHESPPVMTVPLIVLAVFAALLGFLGTPALPWFQGYLAGHAEPSGLGALFQWETFSIMSLSILVVVVGVFAGWRLYGHEPIKSADDPDPLERIQPEVFGVLRGKFFVDELYEASVIRFNAWSAWLSDRLDRSLWNGLVKLVSYLTLGFSWVTRLIDEYGVNLGFDKGCGGIRRGGKLATLWQAGQVQPYLRVIGLALVALVLLLTWGGTKQ